MKQRGCRFGWSDFAHGTWLCTRVVVPKKILCPRHELLVATLGNDEAIMVEQSRLARERFGDAPEASK